MTEANETPVTVTPGEVTVASVTRESSTPRSALFHISTQTKHVRPRPLSGGVPSPQ
jgi:hypothetical protein